MQLRFPASSGFFEACFKGQLSKMKHYMEQPDFDIHATDPDSGLSGLTLAGLSGKAEAAVFLLRAGADIGQVDKNGRSVFHHIAQTGQITVLERIYEFSDKGDLDKQDKFGKTPLMIAAQNMRIEPFRFFLQNGAHPNIQDNNGKTALMIAVREAFAEGVEHLLTYNADIKIADDRGKTPYQEISTRRYSGPKARRQNRCSKAFRNVIEKHKTIDDLIRRAKNVSRTNFNNASTTLIQAAASDHFCSYLDGCAQTGKRLPPEKFYKKNKDDISVIDVLLYKGELDRLWNKEFWSGHEADLRQLYENAFFGWLKDDQKQNFDNLSFYFQLRKAANDATPPALKRRKK